MASFSNHSDLRLEGWSYVGRIRWSWISPDVSPAHLQKGHHVGDTCLSRPGQLGQFPCSQQNQRYNLGNWKVSEMIRVGRFWVFIFLEVSYIYLHPGKYGTSKWWCCTKKNFFERIHVQIRGKPDVFCCLKKIAWSVLDLFLDGGHFSRAGC